MNRRAFFAALAGAGSAFALDPDRALWVPGRKLISIPRDPLTVTVACFQGSWFSAGDLVRFGSDPQNYIVTAVAPRSIDLGRISPRKAIQKLMENGTSWVVRP